jgi:hypothetical protein
MSGSRARSRDLLPQVARYAESTSAATDHHPASGAAWHEFAPRRGQHRRSECSGLSGHQPQRHSGALDQYVSATEGGRGHERAAFGLDELSCPGPG